MKNLLFGQYEVLAPLGEGSNGIVFKVRHHEQGYIRAIKQLKGYIDSKDSDKYRSFLKEYRTLAYLGNCSHPNIVNVHKADMVDDTAFYEMDYIDGVPLIQYMAKEKVLPMNEVYRCCHDLLSAMAYAHVDIYKYRMNREADKLETDPTDVKKVIYDEEKKRKMVGEYGIVHNDLHSSNLIRNNYDGRYILLDFGISLMGGEAIRQSGLGEGSLAYMAPEKILEKKVSFQSDVYSIGIMMYEILTGKVPFPVEDENGADKSSAVMYQIHSEKGVPDISLARAKAFLVKGKTDNYERDFPEWLESIILKCLAKNPEDRYANAKEIFDEFTSHIKTTLSDNNEYKGKALMYDEMKQKVDTMETLMSDYNEIKVKADLYAEQKNKADELEVENGKKDAVIEELKGRNRKLKLALSSNMKRGFTWILVVILAIAVAVIYAPLIAA